MDLVCLRLDEMNDWVVGATSEDAEVNSPQKSFRLKLTGFRGPLEAFVRVRREDRRE